MRRSRTVGALGVAVVLFGGLSLARCGSSPTAPTAAANLIIPSGAVLSVQGCQTVSVTGLFTCTSFTGTLINNGAGCASSVSGSTTTSLISTGMQIGAAEWSYPNLVRPGEQFTYSGGSIAIANTNLWVYSTVPAWTNVPCS